MEEIWKDIKGYEGRYEVSSLGNVRTVKRFVKNKNGMRLVKSHILKSHIDEKGYCKIFLRKEDSGKNIVNYVHRLVAEAFISNPNDYPCIDHIDTNKSNNNVSNLRWVTHIMNMNNPLTKNKMSGRLINNEKRSKEVIQYSVDGVFIKKWPSLNEVERVLGIKCGRISGCCNHKPKHKTAGGYKWEYDDNKKEIV